MLISKRIFVVGCPRSGTTLLQSMLASHPAVLSFPETHAFRLGIGRKGVQLFSWLRRRKLLKAIAKEFGISEPKLPLIIFRQRYVVEMLSLLDKSLPGTGKKVWLEKTPEHIFYISHIQNVDPEAKFIHVTRACRDVVPSIVKMWDKFTFGWGRRRYIMMTLNDILYVLIEVLKRPKLLKSGVWSLFVHRRYVRASQLWHDAMAVTELFDNDRMHFRCDYAELVNDPESMLRKISSFLDLEFSESMLHFQGGASSLIRSDEIWKSNNIKAIEKNKITEYHKLPQDVRKIVLDLCARA